jgi:hypothetical protein
MTDVLCEVAAGVEPVLLDKEVPKAMFATQWTSNISHVCHTVKDKVHCVPLFALNFLEAFTQTSFSQS